MRCNLPPKVPAKSAPVISITIFGATTIVRNDNSLLPEGIDDCFTVLLTLCRNMSGHDHLMMRQEKNASITSIVRLWVHASADITPGSKTPSHDLQVTMSPRQ